MDRVKIKRKLFFYYAILWIALFVALYLSYGVYFLDTTSTRSKWVALFAGAIAFFCATCKIFEVSLSYTQKPICTKITKYFSSGGKIFFKKTSKFAFAFIFIASIYFFKTYNYPYIISLFSGFMSAYICYFTINLVIFKILPRVSLDENKEEKNSSNFTIKQLFNSSNAIALALCSLILIPTVILFHSYKNYEILSGFALGASLCVGFINISSSISKKAYTSASDIVYSHIAQIEKTDRRNPLLLLGGISKSLFSATNVSCDLFVSFATIIISAMTAGAMCLNLMGSFLPLILAATGVFASIIAILFTKIEKAKNPINALFTSMLIAIFIFIGISCFLIHKWLPDTINLTVSISIGAIVGYIILFMHSNCVFKKSRRSLNVLNASISGSNSTFFETLKESFLSFFAPSILLALSIILSFLAGNGIKAPLMGVYGIILSFVSFISTVGIVLNGNIFSYLGNGIDIIHETYEEDVYRIKPKNLTFFGNIGEYFVTLSKNFSSITSIIASLIATIAYTHILYLEEVDILGPYVMGAIFIGAIIPYIFCGFILKSSSGCAKRLTLEVKKQFRKFPQILRFEMRPDYEKCVEIAAVNSSVRTGFYLTLMVVIFLLVYKFLNVEALAGFLFGTIISSFGLMFLSNSSSLIAKTAKKYFENEYDCSKSTEEHRVLINTYEAFESFRDLIVPSLNILIKFLAILALSLAPIFMLKG